MSVPEIVIVLTCLGGLGVIVGAFILLAKKVVDLNASKGENAFTFKFKDLFELTTSSPALGLFSIGLVLVGFSYWASTKLNPLTPIRVSGQIETPDGMDASLIKITVYSSGWPVDLDTQGRILGMIHPDLDTLRLVVAAPGYKPIHKLIAKQDYASGQIALGTINLGHPVAPQPPVNPRNIVDPGRSLQPLASAF